MTPHRNQRFENLMEKLELARSHAETRRQQRDEALQDWHDEEEWLKDNLDVLRDWRMQIREQPLPVRWAEPVDEVRKFGRNAERAIRSHREFKRIARETKSMFRLIRWQERRERRMADGPDLVFWGIAAVVIFVLLYYIVAPWLGR